MIVLPCFEHNLLCFFYDHMRQNGYGKFCNSILKINKNKLSNFQRIYNNIWLVFKPEVSAVAIRVVNLCTGKLVLFNLFINSNRWEEVPAISHGCLLFLQVLTTWHNVLLFALMNDILRNENAESAMGCMSIR